MASSRLGPNLPGFYNSILQALFVLYIFAFILCIAWIFITGDSSGVYVYGSFATYSLLSAVGLVLLQRGHRPGLWLLTVINPGIVILLKFVFNSWLDDIISMSVFGGIMLLIAVPLFIGRSRPSNKIIWNVMDNGVDMSRFRHITQLTVVLLACVGAIIFFMKPAPEAPVIEPLTNEPIMPAPRAVDYSLLDSANVTLDEILVIESIVDSFPPQTKEENKRRVFALKHVLLAGLMTERHNTQSLINIFAVHSGEFSPEQQKIVDWYTSLPQSEQDVWFDCPPVDNLSSFEQEVKQRL